ncbi:hypothetical protein EUGRSUZ_H00880 [Eucalyptus grandis]|uniref:Uncharacterized protein n=2 Tax=Eucalyptus grandis TaxID=71139 RepID=A0ACC3JMN0_EUCGR|nr:hypothetical protein EUGRSUZ_H00880 [Eucalyptus grandis]
MIFLNKPWDDLIQLQWHSSKELRMNIKSCNRSKIFYSSIIFGCNRNASPSEFPTAKYERHKFAVGIEP